MSFANIFFLSVACLLILLVVSFAEILFFFFTQEIVQGFPYGSVVRNLPTNAGDTVLTLGLGGSHMP